MRGRIDSKEDFQGQGFEVKVEKLRLLAGIWSDMYQKIWKTKTDLVVVLVNLLCQKEMPVVWSRFPKPITST
jgi:hypothetical protein